MIEIKMGAGLQGTFVPRGRRLDLRSDMGGFDALVTTGERAHYRFAEGTSQGGM